MAYPTQRSQQVVLLGDKEYDQGHVVKVLCKVIAGLGTRVFLSLMCICV